MNNYNLYIQKLKNNNSEADFERLKAGIEMKVKRVRARNRLAAAGTLVIFLIAAASYLYWPSLTGGREEIMLSYVYQSQGSLDGPMLDYVLEH